MVATSKEDIIIQHVEAEKLVKEDMEYGPKVDIGEIPLKEKQIPTIDRTPNETIPCISYRGTVDVTGLVNLIEEGVHDKARTFVVPSNMKKKIKGTKKGMTAGEYRQERLRSDPIASKTNYWDEVNAAQRNVDIIRPSHDGWGIKKIVLLFCDDFLQTVYELPWWSSFQEAMEPIFQTLHIQSNRVVRLLFAALPPGTTIPKHHDSGEWVPRTHRIHVPILVTDSNQILFRCGPTDETMIRVHCTPGTIFEMNNQARHAVSNCHSYHHRVHLILDYIDSTSTTSSSSSYPRRIQLNPGEQLVQTRRSIDRVSDAGSRPTPSFLILGAQKSGTTSFYEYLNQHPLIVRAKRRETHCLDWRWYPNDDDHHDAKQQQQQDEKKESSPKSAPPPPKQQKQRTVEQERSHCQTFFYTTELHTHPSCLTGDSTPSYLLDSRRCIPRLQRVFPWPLKFFVLLRDPVRRAQSHYAMVTSLDGTPEQIQTRGTDWQQKNYGTLEDVVRLDMIHMKKAGLIPYWNIDEGHMDHDLFQTFAGSKEEDEAWDCYLRDYVPLHTGSHSLISRGLYELNLRPWLRFSYNNNKHEFKIIHLEHDLSSNHVNDTVRQAWEFLQLPLLSLSMTIDENNRMKNTRNYEEMSMETRDYLRAFYEPHNQRLYHLFKDYGLEQEQWICPWSYSDNDNGCGNDDDDKKN